MKFPQVKHPTPEKHHLMVEHPLLVLHLWPHQKNMFCRHLQLLHPGKVSILPNHETELLEFIFKHRKQGIQVTSRMARKFAESILSEFQGKLREWPKPFQQIIIFIETDRSSQNDF